MSDEAQPAGKQVPLGRGWSCLGLLYRREPQNEVGFAFRQGDADRQPGQDQSAMAGPLAGDAKEVAEPLHTGPVVHAGLDLRL